MRQRHAMVILTKIIIGISYMWICAVGMRVYPDDSEVRIGFFYRADGSRPYWVVAANSQKQIFDFIVSDRCSFLVQTTQ